MTGNKKADLTTDQMLNVINFGLRKTQSPKHIIIVGAGMAGLVAGSLLKDSGHKITILEANNRIGGRVYTIRSPFSSGLYFNAGPMRIPQVHSLTLEYIKKFRLPINVFINRNPMDVLYANGIRTRLELFERYPGILRFPVQLNERGKSAEELLLTVVQPFIDFINKDPARNWPILEKQYEKYSFGYILNTYFSAGAIDMIGVLLDLEAFMGMSFTEVLRELTIFTSPGSYYEITGGMDRLPKAFLPQLKDDIHLHQKMTGIVQAPNNVAIQVTHQQSKVPSSITGDLAIVTIPFSVLRFVNVEPFHSFSYYKRRAIRELNYIAATKIAIEFKSRFWEKEGQLGGKTITDLPIRFSFLPSHGIGTRGPAILIASYTWADEALTWDSQPEEARIGYVLKNLAEIYGNQVYTQFVTGASFSWGQNPYASGGFSFFEPGQETELYPSIVAPEGRVHFAGEHTSKNRTWIQGAIESGIRAAYEVNDLPK
ncbi:flavin monoamine oxidase family protein [Bacillus sp. CMF12]|uniref:flavin monoamine oxidase family protein n=1 Tax=Bacillaceae TaxID=186817 RepID=UPI001FB548D3|nr:MULTISPECIES: flavin monoamine oxidase family protein [Bacillaceae]UOE53664.1 flavin monoamine oxidase family protein [Cytobacillus oceanisediminis]USK48103.1 flavin monoamine oxidase family protein [Bacillus sp. CMF12]